MSYTLEIVYITEYSVTTLGTAIQRISSSCHNATLPNLACLYLYLGNLYIYIEPMQSLKCVPLIKWCDIFVFPPSIVRTTFNSTMNTESAPYEQGAQQASEFIKAIFGWQ